MHCGMVGDTAVLQRFYYTDVGVVEGDIFSHQGHSDFIGGMF